VDVLYADQRLQYESHPGGGDFYFPSICFASVRIRRFTMPVAYVMHRPSLQGS